MKIQLIALLLTIVFFGTSCTDNFLEVTPHNSTTTSKALETVKDFRVAANGLYAIFKSSGYYGTYMSNIPAVLTDLVHATEKFSNTYGEMHQYNIHPGTAEVAYLWSSAYTVIANANMIINNADLLEDLTAEEIKERDNIKGEAYCARAIAYYDLVRTYAPTYRAATASTDLGVPVVLSNDNPKPSRNTVAEVYDQIIKDLEKGATLIQNKNKANSEYFNPAICHGYLARVYLTMQEWSLAAQYADKYVDPQNAETHNYHLADNKTQGEDDEEAPFTKMWIDDNSPEVMLTYRFTSSSVSGLPGSVYINDGQGDPTPDYIPSDWVLNLYSRGDVRYDVYFRHNAKTSYEELLELINKYPGNPLFTYNGANQPKPLRLAELYLIAAEAYVEMDEVETARDRLYTLQQSRLETAEHIPLQYVAETIWYERIRELCFEGHYWYDLKRKGMGFKREKQYFTNNATNQLEINADDYRWNLPIPTAEMNANKNMTQNSGYVKE